MTIIEHYRNQFAWRDWDAILAALSPIAGQTVLDLGCGIGVVTAWRERLASTRLLQKFCGAEFMAIRDDFLGALTHSAHTSAARVVCCIAQE